MLQLGGGGNPNDIGRMAYAALILDGQVIVFNIVEDRKRNHADGMELTVGAHSLIVPPVLELRGAEIKRLLREALEERDLGKEHREIGRKAGHRVGRRGWVGRSGACKSARVSRA